MKTRHEKLLVAVLAGFAIVSAAALIINPANGSVHVGNAHIDSSVVASTVAAKPLLPISE